MYAHPCAPWLFSLVTATRSEATSESHPLPGYLLLRYLCLFFVVIAFFNERPLSGCYSLLFFYSLSPVKERSCVLCEAGCLEHLPFILLLKGAETQFQLVRALENNHNDIIFSNSTKLIMIMIQSTFLTTNIKNKINRIKLILKHLLLGVLLRHANERIHNYPYQQTTSSLNLG
eukprot:gene12344-8472_t